MPKLIGVVAPDLSNLGGVQSIVEMVIRLIEHSPDYDYRLISLATSASDSASIRLRSVSSWFKGVRIEQRTWRGRPVNHVGCMLSEFEFMRYQPRKSLNKLLEDCDLVQVIGGFGAWGAAIPKGLVPVANWAATRCAWERNTSLKDARNPISIWRTAMTATVDLIDRQAIATANRFMVMNPLMFEFAKQFSNNVSYAPPGIDIDWFYPKKKTENSKATRYILSVGRFGDERKNPHLLLDAFLKARATFTSKVQLVLAGASEPDESFWQRVRATKLLDEIVFHSNPDKHTLRALYQEAICFALSSNEEGFGMVLIEAMACGIPVVSTRCGGPESIISHGVDGFLVPIGNIDSFAEKLALLANNNEMCKEMAQHARETAVSRFSERVTSEAFLNIWDELSRDN